LLAFPASFAYSILRHRVFDVRVIIRQGVQHAMARGVLLSIVPLLGALLFVDVLIHSDESLAATLKARGWIYVFLGALAGVVYQRRQQWLDQIDRRFFRDRFDTQRLLQEVIHDVKEAKRVDAAAGEVLTRIHQALHPQFIALLQREGSEEEFRSTVCIPVDHSLRVPGDGKLMTLLRLVGKPVQLSASLSLIDALPREEIQFIEEQHLELLVPIQLGSAGSESLLALGPKLSEEPYSREDQKLLSTIPSVVST
jgi:hypothetical protein